MTLDRLTDRQRLALELPLARADLGRDVLAPLRRVRHHPCGWLTSILAIDRQGRLNNGAPVWHVSISLQRPGLGMLDLPRPLEAAAVRLLTEVGGDVEWWYWNPDARVGHLRVPLTPAEVGALAAGGPAEHDAGETGPQRPRTRRRQSRRRSQVVSRLVAANAT